MESLESRLETSASRVALREPFIMAATGKLPRIVVDKDPDFTAATNGTWLKFGREWVEGNVANDEELFGLDLHERLHVVLMHMWRREGRDPGVWNVANDALINDYIKSRGYALPKGGVFIDWVTQEMNSEDVYNKLMQQNPPPPAGKQGTGNPGDGKGQGGSGQPGDGDPSDQPGKGKGVTDKFGKGGFNKRGDIEDAPDEASLADVEATIRAAAQMARDCGAGSSIVDHILGQPPKSSVKWTDEVRAVLTSSARDDFSFRKFSRRFLHSGLYLPSLHSDAIGGLLVGFDVSGSMSPADCLQVAGEIQAIWDDLRPDWIEVVYCTDCITGTQRFERGEELVLKPVGTGGTAFKPVFDYAGTLQEDGQRIAAMVYLTDMCGDLQECVEPDFAVVWGNVYGRDTPAPFGRVVRVIV